MKILDTGIIYRNPIPHIYSRQAYFPSVVRLENGKMVACFSIGEAFESADLHSYIVLSEDGGKTWNVPRELYKRMEGFSDCARISLLNSGEIIAITARHDRHRPDTGLGNPENLGFCETEFYTQKSKDGIHWSEPKKVNPPLVGPSFELCCPVVALRDGQLLLPTSTWRGWNGELPNGTKAVAFVSDNGGESWDTYVDVMCDKAQNLIYWESRVRELPDGALLAMAWTYNETENKDLPIQFALGTTEGFNMPSSTGILGQTLDPVVLKDGRIFSSYRRADKPGLWGNLSRIENGKWINEEEIPLWGTSQAKSFQTGDNMVENFNVLRFGAPNGFEDADGSVYFCFWCVEDTVSNIRYIRVSME